MTADTDERLAAALAEIERLRVRLRIIEAQFAAACGTLERPKEAAPFSFEEVPPNTPR